MVVKGALSEQRFSDLLQMVDSRRKSGVLQLVPARGGKTVRLFFRSGRLLKIEEVGRDSKNLIGEMLVRAGRVQSSELAAALKVHKKTLRRLGDVLVEMGATTSEVVQEFVDLQSREVLHSLFEWTEGKYAFEPGAEECEAVITPMAAERILMEGFRLLDEWPVVRARINNYSIVYRAMRSAPMQSGEGALSPSAISILSLVDARRDVSQIIDSGGQGEFETCKALSSLLTHGYIVPVEVRGAVDDPSGRQSRGWVAIIGSLLLNLIYLVGVGYGAYWLVGSQAIKVETDVGLVPAFLPVEQRVLRSRLTRALGVYRYSNGQYPETLTDLLEGGYLPRYAEGTLDLDPIEYVTIGHDYDLR
jgi:hypothetical protein